MSAVRADRSSTRSPTRWLPRRPPPVRMAALAREAVAARGRFLVAVSGGHSPWRMLEALAAEDVPWRDVQIFQIDERVAPAGDPDRNATHIRESLLARARRSARTRCI